MAMLPFIGYNAGDYLGHWIEVGKAADSGKLPKIFYVNWFRRDGDGNFVWPGFGENIRVLKWALERIEGTAAAQDTAIGRVPTAEALDTDGLDMTREQLEIALAVDTDEWKNEIPSIEEWFDKLGAQLPTSMRDELEALKLRLEA
jgi:phosphoenolpyruvate carboxykinase (GTP)